ncbi:MAG: DNA-protecting protein DprA [Bdellovibrionaceae bacterium]|nr:DNA-protecting protein DprA [Pseudobdellovibrionaceae bacterium]
MERKLFYAILYWQGIHISVEEIEDISSKDFLSLEKWTETLRNSDTKIKVRSLAATLIDKYKKEYDWLIEKGIHVLGPWDHNYPKEFKSLKSQPLLSVMGNIDVLQSPSLAVVGSRQPSQVSIDWMRRELNDFIKSVSVILVSGGARGVDQEVHRLCIANLKPTICFLPSGLARVYPNNLISWFEPILNSGGIIVSQFSPFTQIFKNHFHRRNELIACLSCASFIVEAKLRSGSLLTAQKALHLGREIATLPCSPNIESGRGNLQLLLEGAQMITDSLDLQVFWHRNK